MYEQSVFSSGGRPTALTLLGVTDPAGSVACAEQTEDPGIAPGRQHMYFILASNTSIDVAFVRSFHPLHFSPLTSPPRSQVVSAFVPLVLLWICGENHLRLVWRLCFAIGILPPLLIFFWRLRMDEPERYKKSTIRGAPTPYWLALKRYWRSFLGLSLAWFLYVSCVERGAAPDR